ncbi:flagellar motor protein MotB [uncultured Sphingomonas sp.]|uniref:flagellar motor protein MotB n=1 Tax=uncultured Sphingomonas sp. TaxID=158754 RepID=UPI00262AC4E2|nr:flagellar motor protein MotB [uncultured Sphingomonas sp.]
MSDDAAFDEFPAAAPARPLWLITLADLALLLIGFFVLLQANHQLDPRRLADGLREGFGGSVAMPEPAARAPLPMPLAANAMPGFAPGSAALPASPGALIAWATEAARDPRVALTVTGSTDGSATDVDAATGSAAVLAADRARAVAAALGAVAPGRILVTTTNRPGHRQVTVTFAFAGEGNSR